MTILCVTLKQCVACTGQKSPKYDTPGISRTDSPDFTLVGIPAQVVMKWTGHSDYKAMKPYIDIADDIKANAMNKFNQL